MDPYHDSSDADGEVDPEYAAGGGVLDPSLGVSVYLFGPVLGLGLLLGFGFMCMGKESRYLLSLEDWKERAWE